MSLDLESIEEEVDANKESSSIPPEGRSEMRDGRRRITRALKVIHMRRLESVLLTFPAMHLIENVEKTFLSVCAKSMYLDRS